MDPYHQNLHTQRPKPINLLARMKDKSEDFRENSQNIAKHLQCQLGVKGMSCCRGLGFKLSAEGLFAEASLCDCVKNCVACAGRAYQIKQGVAKPCNTPSPVKYMSLINNAEIPSRYTFARIQEFRNQSGNCKEIVNKAEIWLSQIKQKGSRHSLPKGFILSGSVGIGKSYLMVAILKKLIEKGLSVKFIDFFSLISEIKRRYSSKNKSEGAFDMLEDLMKVDVLAIDELGKGRQTEFEYMVIDQLVMGRYNQNKMIVASTNCVTSGHPKKYATEHSSFEGGDSKFAPEHFPHLSDAVGERIFSRLCETTHFWEMSGNDYRKNPSL